MHARARPAAAGPAGLPVESLDTQLSCDRVSRACASGTRLQILPRVAAAAVRRLCGFWGASSSTRHAKEAGPRERIPQRLRPGIPAQVPSSVGCAAVLRAQEAARAEQGTQPKQVPQPDAKPLLTLLRPRLPLSHLRTSPTPALRAFARKSHLKGVCLCLCLFVRLCVLLQRVRV